jgi:hypothetical protein
VEESLAAARGNEAVHSQSQHHGRAREAPAGSFVSTPSGISLQFNAPFLVNSVTPVLYGQGFGATAPVPSVTLTEAQDATGHPVNSPVEGSLVINTSTNSITFVATNTALEANNGSPILPDGTNTVTQIGLRPPDDVSDAD